MLMSGILPLGDFGLRANEFLSEGLVAGRTYSPITMTCGTGKNDLLAEGVRTVFGVKQESDLN